MEFTRKHHAILTRMRYFLGVGVIGTLLAACASAPAMKYYSLRPQANNAIVASEPVGIYMAPVQIPESIDKVQLMVRDPAEPQVMYALNSSRWAASVTEEIGQALSVYLTGQLGAIGIQNISAAGSMPVWHVQTDVQQFDLIPGETAILDVVWVVKAPPVNQARKKSSWVCQTRINVAVKQPDVAAVVTAQQQAIRLLANEMIKKIDVATATDSGDASSSVQTRACRQV
ncbi:MAG: membrane integrity-associated transporter subunit PqiC [Alcaligenaceae bacterium]|nr:membrane integrity-associated transporter subunit PqiC [Alcaligenaceae bacterium]